MEKVFFVLLAKNIIKVCTFHSKVYSEVKNSILTAVFIVFFIALSHGIAGIIRNKINQWHNPLEPFVIGFQGEIFFWLISSLVYYLIGVRMLLRTTKFTEVLSSIGFSIIPGLLIIAAAFLQLIHLSIPMLIVILIYRFITGTKALRQILQIEFLKAALLFLVGGAVAFFSLALGTRIVEYLLN